MNDVCKDLQEKHLKILSRNGAFQFTETFFPYTSGEIGPYYVQSAVVLKNGEDYRSSIADMGKLVREVGYNPEVISGGESRDWIFSFPIAADMGLPHMMIYKDGKIIGPDVKNKKVVHIADLSNEGSSPRDLWIPGIKDAGGQIVDIFFYVDRLEDGVRVMGEIGLNSHTMVPLDENAWDHLLNEGVIDEQVYSSLRKRMENKNNWAKEMLQSDAGLDQLEKLLRYTEKKNRAKGEKILTVGYPEIKEEVLTRLFNRHTHMKNFVGDL